MATYKYLEYRTRPWNTGRVVYRKNVTGMTKREITALGDEQDKVWTPELHHSAVVTLTGTRVQLPDVNVRSTPGTHNPYLNDNVS